MAQAHANPNDYYVPHGSIWPTVATVSIFCMMLGFSSFLIGKSFGPYLGAAGFCLFVFMLFGWFGSVIRESEAGLYNDKVDISFRMGMTWFIFSEVMFFAAFFGALFYARIYSVPWIGGEGNGAVTNQFLWPGFSAVWPLQQLPDSFAFTQFKETIGAWGVPAYNTAILLTSGFTVTMAHWALKSNNRKALIGWLAATVALGIFFLYLQAQEYGHAFHELDLTMNSGIYGATFFMLTGFHGFHVTMGTIMLAVILARSIKGHFTPKHHFAFEGVAWYWHFVDVVWLGLFIFVYWI
ncbi:MAG: cytochrome c oxidase subunit 3 [Gammaproteobacteria bacterium]|nr:cytochrome c oxidase subunit 3 [Gammaproteobacteria bacterium]